MFRTNVITGREEQGVLVAALVGATVDNLLHGVLVGHRRRAASCVLTFFSNLKAQKLFSTETHHTTSTSTRQSLNDSEISLLLCVVCSVNKYKAPRSRVLNILPARWQEHSLP